MWRFIEIKERIIRIKNVKIPAGNKHKVKSKRKQRDESIKDSNRIGVRIIKKKIVLLRGSDKEKRYRNKIIKKSELITCQIDWWFKDSDGMD